jgi:hypothetical protein
MRACRKLLRPRLRVTMRPASSSSPSFTISSSGLPKARCASLTLPPLVSIRCAFLSTNSLARYLARSRTTSSATSGTSSPSAPGRLDEDDVQLRVQAVVERNRHPCCAVDIPGIHQWPAASCSRKRSSLAPGRINGRRPLGPASLPHRQNAQHPDPDPLLEPSPLVGFHPTLLPDLIGPIS